MQGPLYCGQRSCSSDKPSKLRIPDLTHSYQSPINLHIRTTELYPVFTGLHQLFCTSFCRFQTPSLCVNSSWVMRIFGRMRHSKPHMLKRRFGLSLLYTDTKLFSHCMVVTDRGRRFLMSQKTARPLATENGST